MTYSCAVFDSPEATLAEAQEAKLDPICRKLELTPDDHLLEIGSGWGSLAMHAAGALRLPGHHHHDLREQHATATERVRAAGPRRPGGGPPRGLPRPRGRYDKLVSVEMIEAVGWQYFDDVLPPLRASCSRPTA